MKKIFISVVSHNHANLIKNMGVLNKLSPHYTVVVKSNICEDIHEYCSEHGIININPSEVMGFGENNNVVFNYCISHLGMTGGIFLLFLIPM